MSEKEFETFVNRLFVSFPDVYEWLHANSPDPIATQVTWCTTLKGCRLDECLLVLDGWITGVRPMFKAYERSQIALLVRQSVLFDRDKEAKRNKTEAAGDEYVKMSRQRYQPSALGITEVAEIYKKGLGLNEKFARGEFDKEELHRRRKELLENFR